MGPKSNLSIMPQNPLALPPLVQEKAARMGNRGGCHKSPCAHSRSELPMIVTKHEQACLVIAVEDQTIVIDPGSFTQSLSVPSGLTAIVLTHEHFDHVNADLIHSLLDTHPEATVYAPSSVAAKLDGIPTTIVQPHDSVVSSPFTLQFTGGTHEPILPDNDPIENVGVLINNMLYYPGDSYALPPRTVDTLALPVSGPWFKLSEAVDFAKRVRPRRVIPTHDILNSQQGMTVTLNWLHTALDDALINTHSIEITPLHVGESVELPDRPLQLA